MNARPKYNQYIKETSKVSEIVDKFGNLRFKIVLNDKQLPIGYQVIIFAYCSEGEKELENRNFQILDEAIAFFDETVKKYVYLMKSEQYRPHDIRIYADRIGYRGIYPECCFMCKWSKPCMKDGKLFADDNPERSYNFFCMHPTQFKQRDGRTEDQQVDVHPVVYALCVCDSFERPMITDNSVHTDIHTDTEDRTCGHGCCSDERIMRVIEQNAPVILDILDGIRDSEFNFDGGTSNG